MNGFVARVAVNYGILFFLSAWEEGFEREADKACAKAEAVRKPRFLENYLNKN